MPVVLPRQEVKALLGHLDGDKWLIASLMDGAGLRLMECPRLRIHALALAQNQLTVRDGKGCTDRITMRPEAVTGPLADHLERVKRLHQRDLAEGHGRVELPSALARKAGIAKHATCHTLRHYSGSRTMPGGVRTGRPSAC